MGRRQWNTLARRFEQAVCDVTASSGNRLADLVRSAKPSRRQVLVDAGCGIGSFARRFGRRFGRVIAFDFATQMVARARRRCDRLPDVRWMTLPLEDAAEVIGPVGHLAACLNVITSTDATLRERQWASLAGLTRPGGRALVVVPSVESARHVMRVAGEEADGDAGLFPRGDDRQTQKHYTRDELRETLADHGLRVVALRRIHYPWADEGLDVVGRRRPWSWACLARRPRSGR